MDHYLQNVNNGVDREKPVRLFVMGDNAWRDEDSWPLARAEKTSYYLNASRGASRIGTLNSSLLVPSARTSEFVSDPAHPLTDPYTEYGAHDYRAFAGRDDVLVFDTAPLRTDTEVTGPIRAEIFVSADVPDFDLWVRLLDVAPDGTAFNLMSPGLDVLRASYRNASLKPELLTPGKVYLLTLDRMLTSNVFRSGHHVRVQISAAFSPHFSRNLQTGESEITSSETQLGHIRIYHDAEHSSRIVLPIIPRAKQ
jgi:putative CocE/NonD family hydrolase